MRVIPLYQTQQWAELGNVAKNWRASDKNSAEACYYLGLAEDRQGNEIQTVEQYHKAIELNPQHAGAFFELGMISSRHGNKEEVHRINLALNHLDQELAEQFQQAAGCNSEC